MSGVPGPAAGRPSAHGDTSEDGLSSLTYEQLVEELERTIDRMARGDIGIEEVTELYERAGRLHGLAAARLARIAERIDRLTGGHPS